MSGLVGMALRNLGRRRLRTALTGSMIAGGTALAVLSLGMNFGTYDHMIDLATRSSVGHLEATRAGYDRKPRLNKTLVDPAAAEATLRAQPAVQAVSPRVEAGGLFAKDARTIGGLLVGVDPVTEGSVTSVPRSLGEGAWLPTARGVDDPIPAVFDAGLLHQLRAAVGDEVSFVGQAADGSLAAELFTVCGVTKLKDGAMAYVRLADARDLLVLPGRVHRLVARVDSLRHVDEVVLGARPAEGDVVQGWDALLPGLARSIEADRASGWIFLAIVLMVVLLGVANTLLMAVFERTHEFGVLMALGTRPRQIVLLTLAEAGWLAVLAATVGGIAGTAATAWVGVEGIPLGDMTIEYGGVTIDRMIAVNSMLGSVGVPAVVAMCALLAAAVPAWRAARLHPTEALRA